MAKITKETVEKIARLAHLKFEAGELEKYAQKFARVLAYVENLDKLDTKNVEPTAHADGDGQNSAMRDDNAVNFTGADEILKNAPAKSGRFIEVPKVIE